MVRGLTDIAIKHLRAGAVRREIPDKLGLYLIIEPSGFKSFATRTRIAGKPVKISHGNISLSVARKLHTDALHEIKEGRDPRVAKLAGKAHRRAVQADTFAAMVELYFRLEGDKHRTAHRRRADLERLVIPTLGRRPITLIKRSEIVAVLDKIEMQNGPVMADRTLGMLRRLFNWHSARADDFRSPIVKGMARHKAVKRERILTDDEIRKIWVDAPGPFPALVKFLLLTGARRDEAAKMTWGEVVDGTWELPAARNKTKLDLCRPLSAAATAVIESQRGASDYVFTANGKSGFSDFGRAKAAFDAATGTSGWTIHDVRRTSRSLMSRAGVDRDHAERCLGHVIPGVEGIYNRHHYQPEMQHAYDLLAGLLQRIINPPEGNVTQLRKKR
jgi:integrase